MYPEDLIGVLDVNRFLLFEELSLRTAKAAREEAGVDFDCSSGASTCDRDSSSPNEIYTIGCTFSSSICVYIDEP